MILPGLIKRQTQSVSILDMKPSSLQLPSTPLLREEEAKRGRVT